MHLGKWKLVCLLTMASLGAMGMYAQDSEREMERFGLGQQLGDCLVKGCVVFMGRIQSLGNPEPEPGEPDPQRGLRLHRCRKRQQQCRRGDFQSKHFHRAIPLSQRVTPLAEFLMDQPRCGLHLPCRR